ncbi:MAG: flagellar motor protein MotD [Thiohalobacteraceae bacterium]
MARKPKHEERENHERWLVSYADFITLLFAFFVVMYSISSVNEGKYRVLSDSLTAAFRSAPHSVAPVQVGEGKPAHSPGEIPLPGSPSLIALPVPVLSSPVAPPPPDHRQRNKDLAEKPTDARPTQPAPPSRAERDMGEIADRIIEAMSGLIRDDLINVRRDARWLEVEINSSILFPSGSAKLADAAFPMLQELARILSPFPNPVHVEGFTDNVPIHNLQFLSNWELSAARAASVVHLFTDYGVEPGRMAAIGYGEYKPIGDNTLPDGRAQNRRVVLVVLSGEDPRWMDALPEPDDRSTDPLAEQVP